MFRPRRGFSLDTCKRTRVENGNPRGGPAAVTHSLRENRTPRHRNGGSDPPRQILEAHATLRDLLEYATPSRGTSPWGRPPATQPVSRLCTSTGRHSFRLRSRAPVSGTAHWSRGRGGGSPQSCHSPGIGNHSVVLVHLKFDDFLRNHYLSRKYTFCSTCASTQPISTSRGLMATRSRLARPRAATRSAPHAVCGALAARDAPPPAAATCADREALSPAAPE